MKLIRIFQIMAGFDKDMEYAQETNQLKDSSYCLEDARYETQNNFLHQNFILLLSYISMGSKIITLSLGFWNFLLIPYMDFLGDVAWSLGPNYIKEILLWVLHPLKKQSIIRCQLRDQEVSVFIFFQLFFEIMFL